MPRRTPEPQTTPLESIRGIVGDLLASGLPQEIVRAGANFATSMAQSAATNPMAATGTVFIGAGVAERIGLLSRKKIGGITPAQGLQAASLVYLASEQITGAIGGLASRSENKSVAFDIPDTATPRLPPGGGGGFFSAPRVPAVVGGGSLLGGGALTGVPLGAAKTVSPVAFGLTKQQRAEFERNLASISDPALREQVIADREQTVFGQGIQAGRQALDDLINLRPGAGVGPGGLFG